MRRVRPRLGLLAVFGCLLAGVASAPHLAAADGIENGTIVPNSSAPQGNAVEPVVPRNLSVTSSLQTLSVAAAGIRSADLDVELAVDDVWAFDNLAFNEFTTGAMHPTGGRIQLIYR